jgi:hypothetical protein
MVAVDLMEPLSEPQPQIHFNPPGELTYDLVNTLKAENFDVHRSKGRGCHTLRKTAAPEKDLRNPTTGPTRPLSLIDSCGKASHYHIRVLGKVGLCPDRI